MEIPWVESPFFDTLLERSELDEEQRQLARQYSEQGYVVVDRRDPNTVIDGVIEGLRGEFGKVRVRLHRHPDPGRRSASGSRDRRLDRCTDLLRMLYRREPFPFQTLNFEVGTQQGVHNDAIHFHAIPHRFMCGVWIALEDTDAENGPLFYYPGSHKLPIYEMPDFGLPASTESYAEWGQAVEALLRPVGSNSRNCTPSVARHSSGRRTCTTAAARSSTSNRTRLSQVSHYFFEPALYLLTAGTDLVKGTLHLRDVCDLRTGEMVPHVYRGEVIHRPTEPGVTVVQFRKRQRRCGTGVDSLDMDRNLATPDGCPRAESSSFVASSASYTVVSTA